MTPLLVAVLLLALCAVAAWQVTVIPASMMEMAVGATLAPAVIVGALSLVAVLYGISAWRGRQVDTSHEPGQEPLPGAGVRMASLLGAGVVFIALVIPLGFVVPATLAGMGVARAFDAPFGLKSAVVCGGIALLFWLLFAQVLGVGLGPAVAWAF